MKYNVKPVLEAIAWEALARRELGLDRHVDGRRLLPPETVTVMVPNIGRYKRPVYKSMEPQSPVPVNTEQVKLRALIGPGSITIRVGYSYYADAIMFVV